VSRRTREIVTPEGVPLVFEVAPLGDRAVAFALDALVVVLVSFALAFAALLAGIAVGELALAAFLLAWFLLRTFYFTVFEGLWSGRTPGKRALRIRVIDRRGGPLTGAAVFARNLTRELELFLPLVAIFAPDSLLPDVPAWTRALALGWVVALVLVPFFTPDRLRAGDLLAGTLVVRIPRARLLDDLAEAAPVPEAALTFTPEQLDLYGIYELQVLEGVLRGNAPDRAHLLGQIAAKVRQKIGWKGPAQDPEDFLNAFYAAQRRRLEQRMVLGQRRERKADPGERPTRRP
jgi:uncharacterized RDD family membrane protein YckC